MSRLQLARAMFDLHSTPPDPVPGAAAAAAIIDDLLGPGQIALITGPSGAGKTTILRLLRRRLRARSHVTVAVKPDRLPSTRVIDSLSAPLPATLCLLASCGLADASILDRRAHELSTGQRWRLALALAMRRVQRLGERRHATLLIDELGSTLDRTASLCLCRTLRRWIGPRSIRAVCAAHDDALLEALAPSVLAIQPLNAAAAIQSKPRMNADERGSAPARDRKPQVSRKMADEPNSNPACLPIRAHPRSSVAPSA